MSEKRLPGAGISKQLWKYYQKQLANRIGRLSPAAAGRRWPKEWGGGAKMVQDDVHYGELIHDQRQELERMRGELQGKDHQINELIQRIPMQPQLPAPKKPWWKFWE